MKKIIVAISVVLLIGMVSISAYACNGCGGYGNGHHMMSNTSADYQAFYDDTTTIRTSIAADRSELNALMAGNNPDSKRARTLTEQISKSEIELRKIAKKHDTGITGMRGYGQGWNCGISGHGHNFGGCW